MGLQASRSFAWIIPVSLRVSYIDEPEYLHQSRTFHGIFFQAIGICAVAASDVLEPEDVGWSRHMTVQSSEVYQSTSSFSCPLSRSLIHDITLKQHNKVTQNNSSHFKTTSSPWAAAVLAPTLSAAAPAATATATYDLGHSIIF